MADILQDAGQGAALGSVIPGVGTLVGGLGGAALGLIGGLFQKKKGNQLLKQNPFPTEAMPPEVLANQQIAQGAAEQGMPSEQYQQAQRNIERNQAAAMNSATDRRSGVQSVGAIQQASNDATGNLDAQSAEMRRQNIGQLLNVNNQVASWKDKLFDANQRQKYIQNYNYGMGLVGQGNQNMMGGADRLLGTVAGAAASGLFGTGGASASSGRAPYESPGVGLADTGGASVANPVASPAAVYGGMIGKYGPPSLIAN